MDVVAYQAGQFDYTLVAYCRVCGGEGSVPYSAAGEQFGGVGVDGVFCRAKVGGFLPIAQGVDDLVFESGLASKTLV